MRAGLQALRCGKLDERDMCVFTGVSVVGMSPPNVFGGAEGTIRRNDATRRLQTNSGIVAKP